MKNNNIKRKNKIISKIKTNGFSLQDFFKFKAIYKEANAVFNDKTMADVTLRTVIASLSDRSFDVVSSFIKISLLFLACSVFFGDIVQLLIIVTAFFFCGLFMVLMNARENSIPVTTQFKLIKLYIRSLF